MAFGKRRIAVPAPRLEGRAWNDVARELQEFLEDIQGAGDEGLPAGFATGVDPEDVAHDVTADDGNEATGWAAADHKHALDTTGSVAEVALDEAEGSGVGVARKDHVHGVPATTNGDILTVIAGVLDRLAVGSVGEVLTVRLGQPEWRQPPDWPRAVMPQITADVDDWGASDVDPLGVWELDADTDGWKITGIENGDAGSNSRVLLLVNTSAYEIVLSDQDTNSTAAHRFNVENSVDYVLAPGEMKLIYYRTELTPANNRWFVPRRPVDSGTTLTLAAAATTFAMTSGLMTVTGDGGGNTIATITGARGGDRLTLIFVDGNVTITDDNSHAANSIDLSAAFTSADDTVLELIHDGTSWYEVSRSAN